MMRTDLACAPDARHCMLILSGSKPAWRCSSLVLALPASGAASDSLDPADWDAGSAWDVEAGRTASLDSAPANSSTSAAPFASALRVGQTARGRQPSSSQADSGSTCCICGSLVLSTVPYLLVQCLHLLSSCDYCMGTSMAISRQ